ncbi:MAG: hypothetical protein WBB07_09905 [Mycobacterium sp.]
MPKKSEQDLLREIELRLIDVFTELDPQSISSTIGQAHAQFHQSTIRDFVPLLVERRARRALTALS